MIAVDDKNGIRTLSVMYSGSSALTPAWPGTQAEGTQRSRCGYNDEFAS